MFCLTISWMSWNNALPTRCTAHCLQGQTDRQFFRLQVTAGRDSIEDNSDETLAYSGEEVVLTKDSQKDPQ